MLVRAGALWRGGPTGTYRITIDSRGTLSLAESAGATDRVKRCRSSVK